MKKPSEFRLIIDYKSLEKFINAYIYIYIYFESMGILYIKGSKV